MTIRRLISLAARLLGIVVLVTSGTYLLVYLYRWEWNRALISGLFFVAAEVALATGAFMRRFERIERRLDQIQADPQGSPSARPAGGAVERPHPFAWLEPETLGVFVPVLLGIGVILSAIAYVVERVAALSGTWESHRAIERRFTFVGGSLGEPEMPGAAMRPSRDWQARLRTVMVAVAAVVALAASVLVIAGLTQYRADGPGAPGTSTVYELTVEFRGVPGDPLGVTETLTSTCRAVLDERTEFVIAERPGVVEIRVSPSPGDNDERRFLGCLNDAGIDRVRVEAERSEPRRSADEVDPTRTLA
jgi:hypothetical protein